MGSLKKTKAGQKTRKTVKQSAITPAITKPKKEPINPNSVPKVLSSIQNSAFELCDQPSSALVQPTTKKGVRKYRFKSEETRQRVLSKLKPIQKGQVLNPNGRPPTKPFHQAAQRLAEANWQDLGINPNDTVAEAMMKMLAVRALSGDQQAVSSSKELADRAEGSPVQIHEHSSDGSELANKGLEDILVRFGIQISTIQRNA